MDPIKWFVENFSKTGKPIADSDLSPEEKLEMVAKKIPTGSQGLMLVPYWNSAMNPYWDAGASGIVVGWRGIHQKGHMYRAILEGIAFEKRLHLNGVEQALGRVIDKYVAVGGGAQNNLWCQIIADVTGKPVFRTRTREATFLGAGILAAYAAGWYENIHEAAAAMVHYEREFFEPDSRRHEYYTLLYEDIYQHLFPSQQPYLSRLTDIASQYEDDLDAEV